MTGYKIYFKYEPVDDGYAEIYTNQSGMIATVILNSEVRQGDRVFKNIERSAKHEAMHLLLMRLQNGAYNRFARQADIDESVEEIVFKLEKLIPDIKED